MKKTFILLGSLFIMMVAGMSLKAQEITITLWPGWNWISYPNAEAMDIATTLGDFTPMQGDILCSQYGFTTYTNGHWRGSLTQFTPGWGYMYYSARTAPILFVFASPSTPAGVLTVTTNEPDNITMTSATCGGSAVSNDGTPILMKGVCWATHPQPTTYDSYSENGNASGDFTVELTALTSNTVYYVRAYAVSVKGVNYGDEMSFSTPDTYTPAGAINGKFTINENGVQVYFSKGNLQYIGSASTPYWKFANNQWDFLGETTGQNSDSVNVDRDLFGWGTSGYDHGAVCYQPWSTSTAGGNYNVYGAGNYNLYDQTGQADWGYNPISNGGNVENSGWHTLTREEWEYVLKTRSTASGNRYVRAKVNNIAGIILLPDDWDASYYPLNNSTYGSNIITSEQWPTLEEYGAVFLPVTGSRDGTSVSTGNGHYWSASYSSSYYAYYLYFTSSSLSTGITQSRRIGTPVRLVHGVQPYTISVSVNLTEGGTITGGGTYQQGQTCVLTATTNTGYAFVNWTENGSVVSTNPTYSFAVNANRTLVANYAVTPTGAIDGLFSVNDSTQVFFSQGNLQYIGSASTPYWKFADNQWDYFGETTGQDSENVNVDRDLFGWSTSGYAHGATCYQPWSTSSNYNDYYAYGNSGYNLYDQTGQADWGYNPISNGGNQPNQWRTLPTNEWNYVFNTRSTASGIRYAKANVNNVNGVILLPDDWRTSTYSLNNTNDKEASFTSNTLTASQWDVLEQHGAIFLSAAGSRSGTSISDVGNIGRYWSASHDGQQYAYSWNFSDSNLSRSGYRRHNGFSVRLVRAAE